MNGNQAGGSILDVDQSGNCGAEFDEEDVWEI